MSELEIHTHLCHVDKRALALDFTVDGIHYRFTHNHWDWKNDGVNTFTEDGIERKHRPELVNPEDWPFYTIVYAYKHTFTAILHSVGKEKEPLFIDRAYRHNTSFHVYFCGKAYEVGKEDYHGPNALPASDPKYRGI